MSRKEGVTRNKPKVDRNLLVTERIGLHYTQPAMVSTWPMNVHWAFYKKG